jgi:transcriptional regulator GlxA family with amidase domain
MKSSGTVFAVYDGAVALDVFGPHDVLSAADWILRQEGQAPRYRPKLASPGKRTITLASGVRVECDAALERLAGAALVIVPGGVDRAGHERVAPIVEWLRRRAAACARVASVCTGALVLAEAGLLDGRRATTHWAYAGALAERYPRIQVEPDALHVRDGPLWTSAGVTAGIDLALAMVEADLGPELAQRIARQLVVFLRRPGGQSQFSAQLAAQAAGDRRIAALQQWIVDHVDRDVRVPALARRVAMSPRHFARRFVAETGVTPAVYVARCRVDKARALLETTDLSLDLVARFAGLESAEILRRTFQRQLRVSPRAYRARFSRPHEASGARSPRK